MTRASDQFALTLLMRLCALSILLFASLGSTNARAAAASTYVFDGNKVTGCPLSSTTYTCNNFPLTGDTDKMTIADGYTVIVKASAVFTYNQSLAMSGSATLNATGNLNIGDINPPNLSIKGGDLISGGTFTIGNQAQSITANVSAVTMTLGSGSTTRITGNVTASGNITVGSHATIVGALSGAAITTNSPVVINGDVNATTSFTLASGSRVSGDIVAPTVSLLASQSTVNGNITARNSLQLGDKVNVTGDVSAGNLTLDSSSAIINGNATVDRATLNWAGRVTKMIYCTGGTTTGQCDCVTNNSGYPVNTAEGPHCAAPPSATPIDHFLIVHDGSASACTSEPVTVKACANAACTSYYTGNVNVTLAPGGKTFTIGSSGVSSNATVSQAIPGPATLQVSSASVAAANALQCSNTSNGSGACGMNFSGEIGLGLSMQDQYSATVTAFTLAARVYDPKPKSCVPAFAGQAKTIQLSCNYSNPAQGSQPLKVGTSGQALSAFTALNAANASTGRCDGSTRDFNVTFASDGTVPFSMYYADVGLVSVNASMSDKSASSISGSAVVAPHSFQIASFDAATIAGKPFKVVAKPLNAEGNWTPNFGLEKVPETVKFSLGDLNTVGCKLSFADLGSLTQDPTTSIVGTGVQGNITYTEAGALNIRVQQASANYLGGSIPRPAATQTNAASSGCGAISSVPAYFEVRESRVGTAADKVNFYYSGEPVDVTVTARNATGDTTTLYDNSFGYSKVVLFTAFDAAGATAIPATTGGLSGTGASATTPLPAAAFTKGVASVPASAASPLVFRFAKSPSAPTKIRLRAAEPGAGGVSSKNGGAEDVYEARSGRLTIASRFGSAKGDLVLPVTLQYWTGSSWIRNLDHGEVLPPVPASAVALQATAPLSVSIAGMSGISQGLGSLTLRPTGGTGTATVAINLGATTTDNSCLPAPRPTSTGARMPWLRGPNGICAGTAAPTADPAARATFGIYKPEAKRLIHTREVFN